MTQRASEDGGNAGDGLQGHARALCVALECPFWAHPFRVCPSTRCPILRLTPELAVTILEATLTASRAATETIRA